MNSVLTSKQKKLLQIIKEYRREHGISPTFAELKTALDVKFINSIVLIVKALEQKGYIRREKGADRGIEPIEMETSFTMNVPIVGAVACGQPLLAQENIEGYVPVSKNLLHGQPKDYFFLRAVGDSMNEAEINDGDLVLIKSQNTAQANEKIVALIDDSATIKFYKPYKDYVALVPKSSNSSHKPIYLHNDFTIQGVVKAVYKDESVVK